MNLKGPVRLGNRKYWGRFWGPGSRWEGRRSFEAVPGRNSGVETPRQLGTGSIPALTGARNCCILTISGGSVSEAPARRRRFYDLRNIFDIAAPGRSHVVGSVVFARSFCTRTSSFGAYRSREDMRAPHSLPCAKICFATTSRPTACLRLTAAGAVPVPRDGIRARNSSGCAEPSPLCPSGMITQSHSVQASQTSFWRGAAMLCGWGRAVPAPGIGGTARPHKSFRQCLWFKSEPVKASQGQANQHGGEDLARGNGFPSKPGSRGRSPHRQNPGRLFPDLRPSECICG